MIPRNDIVDTLEAYTSVAQCPGINLEPGVSGGCSCGGGCDGEPGCDCPTCDVLARLRRGEPVAA